MRLGKSKRRVARIVAGFVLAASLSLTSVWAESAPIHVTLLQVNDVYQIAPVDKGQNGGLARIATLVKRFEQENPNTFLVLGGDTLSPSLASKLFQGNQMIEVWNQVGLDVAVLGNHEFDFGNDVLLQRMQESKFPWLNANAIDENTGKPFGNSVPYWIKEVEGVKIGFFGVLTTDTKTSSYPGKNVRFDDPFTSANKTLHLLSHEGADVVVAVTHLTINEDKHLAQSHPLRLAVIMGGHEHTLLQSVAGGTPIYKMGSDARTLGKIDLWIDPQSHTLQSLDFKAVPVNSDTPEDPAVLKTVQAYEEKINSALAQPLGQTSVVLDARQLTNRSVETNLGNWVTDVYRQKLNTDVAIINGGSIRANTTLGPCLLSKKDILTLFPFCNPVVKIRVTGLQIKQALENGVSRLGEEAGRFPQVSGIRFSYDGRKPVGSRVVKVAVNGKPLDLKKQYTLAATTYLIGGGDDYSMFKNPQYLLNPEEAPLEADLLEDAVRDAKTIAPQTDGRIQRLD